VKARVIICLPPAPRNGILPWLGAVGGLADIRLLRFMRNRRVPTCPGAVAWLALPLLGGKHMTTPVAHHSAEARFRSLQAEAHPFCFVCSSSNPMGLALRYSLQPDGAVAATFLGHGALEGYPGLLHGGVTAALLDGAMTHCLFAQNRRAMTVELNVRYHAAIASAEEVSLRAWLEDSCHGLFQLRAELSQTGVVKASATGKFMNPP
jgi:acyl-coenzyme A thioesterase PaaI-like protein